MLRKLKAKADQKTHLLNIYNKVQRADSAVTVEISDCLKYQ